MKTENVQDYPTAARCEVFSGDLKVEHEGITIAETKGGYRVIERHHPPTYYFPPEDVNIEFLSENAHRSFCEWKGVARYYDVTAIDLRSINAAWVYSEPSRAFLDIKGYISFYASKVDHCYVNGERVVPQPSDFYGGWVTHHLQGDFKR